MDFRALPPQRRQGIGRSHAGPDTRFGKRRSDRFAIFCQSLQLLGEASRSFHSGLPSGRAGRKLDVISAVAGEQAPGDARVLVGERPGDDVGMSPLPHLAKPQASWILLFSNAPKSGAGAVDQQGAQIAIATFADDK